MDSFFKTWRRELVICLCLAAVSLFAYGKIINHAFVNYDDPTYVTENPHVKGGLTREGIIWALTTHHDGNWFPLTWMSHMLDYALFRLNPMGHHWTNLLIHMANAILLFLVFRLMTKAVWKSAVMAALFAIHPLHVESVAWVAERKDILSTFFGMLMFLSYYRYVKERQNVYYLLTLFFFCLGLMAKPMLVTLPFVLLLLDYWPLERFGYSHTREGTSIEDRLFFMCVREKIPLFALSVLSSVMTFFVQLRGGGVKSLGDFSLSERISNAFVSYVKYMAKAVWPDHLAVFYPHPGSTLPGWQIAAAVVLIFSITFFALRGARKLPYLAVGWLWYLGTLIPVIGLVQVGAQAMADRYTYIPLTGLFILVVWGASDLTSGWHYRKIVLVVSGAAMLSILTARTYFQVDHWKNSVSLFEHTINITRNNGRAYNNLGNALSTRGEFDKADFYLKKALRLNPENAMVLFNLGKNQFDWGHFDTAASYYRRVLKINPEHTGALNNLANLLAEKGRYDEAVSYYQAVLQIETDAADTHNNLAIVRMLQGKNREALFHFKKAVEIDPQYTTAYFNLGRLLILEGKPDEALPYAAEAIKINPTVPEAYNQIGEILALKGKFGQADFFFAKALEIDQHFEGARKNLENNRKKISSRVKVPRS